MGNTDYADKNLISRIPFPLTGRAAGNRGIRETSVTFVIQAHTTGTVRERPGQGIFAPLDKKKKPDFQPPFKAAYQPGFFLELFGFFVKPGRRV